MSSGLGLCVVEVFSQGIKKLRPDKAGRSSHQDRVKEVIMILGSQHDVGSRYLQPESS